mmetsp:Transcript_17306/g.40609  ORF Transcript_17306/g.40609 Transcript_17306/m.40609 type:complete len:308 (+) Transcript_17306:975-1898(+)
MKHAAAQPKVAEPHVARVGVNQDVGGLEVTVHHASHMHVVEARQALIHDPLLLVLAQRSAAEDDLLKITAHELGDDVHVVEALDAGWGNHVVQRDHVRMAELAHQTDLTKNPFGVDHIVKGALHLLNSDFGRLEAVVLLEASNSSRVIGKRVDLGLDARMFHEDIGVVLLVLGVGASHHHAVRACAHLFNEMVVFVDDEIFSLHVHRVHGRGIFDRRRQSQLPLRGHLWRLCRQLERLSAAREHHLKSVGLRGEAHDRGFRVERELAAHVGKVGPVLVVAQLAAVEDEVASLPAHAALLTQVPSHLR